MHYCILLVFKGNWLDIAIFETFRPRADKYYQHTNDVINGTTNIQAVFG